ncbi:MAG TPA: dUTP diphosphatase [Firmicutes bacterium]|nr:dUTP diphosphatase [Bacillota bacterium]
MRKTVKVMIKELPHFKGLTTPAKMTCNAAGIDLAAAVADTVEIEPGDYKIIPTGLAIAIPDGYEGQVRPRSGLALKLGLSVLNTPGTIDADYRGEIKIILINLGRNKAVIKRGDRIAQLVVSPTPEIEMQVVDELPDTKRGTGGFGHTGL